MTRPGGGDEAEPASLELFSSSYSSAVNQRTHEHDQIQSQCQTATQQVETV